MTARERREHHIQTLKKMREVMLKSENWESLKDCIEAVTTGAMALQRLNDIDYPERTEE